MNEIDKIKKELLEQVSHHIRSPLTSIKNVIEDIHSGVVQPTDESTYNKYISIARRNIKRLIQNVDSIFDLSALLAKKKFPHRVFVDPAEMINSIILYYKEIALDATIELFLDNSNNTKLLVDRGMISTVFYKIFDNSVQYGGKETKISIRCLVNKDETRITISNTESSIPSDIKDKIFDNFGVEDHNVSGLGIGLSIVKEIIELHGGHIWLEDGNRAEISFTLPNINTQNIVEDIINSETDRALKSHEHFSIIRISFTKQEATAEDIEQNLLKVIRKKNDFIVRTPRYLFIFLRETDRREAGHTLARLNSLFVSSVSMADFKGEHFWSYPGDELTFDKDIYWK